MEDSYKCLSCSGAHGTHRKWCKKYARKYKFIDEKNNMNVYYEDEEEKMEVEKQDNFKNTSNYLDEV